MGDSVMAVVINSSNTAYSLTVNLPFIAMSGESIKTTETADMAEAAINMQEGTANPEVTIDASSVTTLIFSKSSTTSLAQVKNQPTVLSEEYYTLLGQRVYSSNNNFKGIYIVKSLMSDGSVRSRKIIIK
jgi:hypothetical protein